MSNSSDIIIAGAGPAGLTLALALAKSGYTVTILEKRSLPRKEHSTENGAWGTRERNIVIDAPTVSRIESLNVRLSAEEISYLTIQTDESVNSFPSSPPWGSAYGLFFKRNPTHISSLCLLEQDLLESARAQDSIKIVFGAQNVSLRNAPNGVVAYFEVSNKSNVIEAKIAFNATGLNSDLLFKGTANLRTVESTKGQHYLGAAINSSNADTYGVLGLYPNCDRPVIVSSTFRNVVVVYTQLSESLIDINEEEEIKLIKKVARELGESETLRHKPFRFSGELVYLEQVISGRVVNIGDAVRSTNPASGSGVNIAVADAIEIANELVGVRALLGEQCEWDRLRSKLLRVLRKNTIDSQEQSLYAVEMLDWAVHPKNFEKLAKLWRLGLLQNSSSVDQKHPLGIMNPMNAIQAFMPAISVLASAASNFPGAKLVTGQVAQLMASTLKSSWDIPEAPNSGLQQRNLLMPHSENFQ